MTKTQLIILLAALLGSILKVWSTTDQKSFSKQSIIDVIIGGGAGILVPIYLPSVLPDNSNAAVLFVIIMLLSYSSNTILTVAMERLKIAPSKDSFIAPKPPTP